jgi:hypothetical protein
MKQIGYWSFWPAADTPPGTPGTFRFDFDYTFSATGGNTSGDLVTAFSAVAKVIYYWQSELSVTITRFDINSTLTQSLVNLSPNGVNSFDFNKFEFSTDYELESSVSSVVESPFPDERVTFDFAGDGWFGIQFAPDITALTVDVPAEGTGAISLDTVFLDFRSTIFNRANTQINPSLFGSSTPVCTLGVYNGSGTFLGDSTVTCGAFPITWYRTEDLRLL